MKKLSALLLTVLALASIAPIASAAPKFVKTAPNDDVVGTGFMNKEKVVLTYEGINTTKEYTANSCGMIKLTGIAPDTGLAINGTSLPSSAWSYLGLDFEIPSCGFPPDIVTVNPQADGTWTITTPKSYTPGRRYSVTLSGKANRTVTANSCGFVNIKNSDVYTGKPFKYNGTTVTPTAITVAPRCVSGTALYPLNFPGISYTP
jgi:hypothetical protein